MIDRYSDEDSLPGERCYFFSSANGFARKIGTLGRFDFGPDGGSTSLFEDESRE